MSNKDLIKKLSALPADAEVKITNEDDEVFNVGGFRLSTAKKQILIIYR